MSTNTQQSEFRTAESVSPMHPDKICDQISDAILDAYLAKDPNARVAVDVAGGHGQIFITGEVTSRAVGVDTEYIASRIAGDSIKKIIINLVEQSPEISQGVDTGGAGDQGIMIGYATSETDEMLPIEVVMSRSLNKFLYDKWPYDGKTQVTISNGEIHSIVASFQNVSTDKLEAAVKEWARKQKYNKSGACFVKYRNSNPQLYINPAGDWSQGGFEADAGLTGRKLAVDNYGPRIAIGGGAFSGKDPSKVDRSAAYMARKIAVDYLKTRGANEVYVRLAYAIGRDQPLEASVIIDGKHEVAQGYDLTPRGIIKFLNLLEPIYEDTARYGHFGHNYRWEI